MIDNNLQILYPIEEYHIIMGMRKKIRTKWKADRKVDITRRRKQKAIRIVKKEEAVKVA